ncbi:hypothetical protein ACEUZ9_001093 [Paracoccus litorisediminis]|uniref:hypothetical protein n=1 Tax=Paracoccus litorisediminis TaxID=2006130 RepID=UPI00372FE0D1
MYQPGTIGSEFNIDAKEGHFRVVFSEDGSARQIDQKIASTDTKPRGEGNGYYEVKWHCAWGEISDPVHNRLVELARRAAVIEMEEDERRLQLGDEVLGIRPVRDIAA